MVKSICVNQPIESQDQSEMVIPDVEYFWKLSKEGSVYVLIINEVCGANKNKQANFSSA